MQVQASVHDSAKINTWQKLVVTDPVAFKYLEDDTASQALDRRRELLGYELYVVEQWACSRVDPTIVITTFTGQVQHKVIAGVLNIPEAEKDWSPRLKIYMRSVLHYQARQQHTPLGTLMVTNLSTFPSTLTIVHVPDGDIRKHRETFFVNENLKRLGCSGRSGLSLSQASEATVTRFRNLYQTAERVSVGDAVIGLVQLCQIALTTFAKLPREYSDGLLCDLTERALSDWWTEIGLSHYSAEPTDGILGPTTVAALLGLLLGARNRLHACNAPVPKDAFDVHALRRGIGYFQKAQRLPKTRRLDRETLKRLHRVTAKAAASDRWTVPRAVKSTVAELGKGGEMVMGIVGGKDKAGIADIETADFNSFRQRLTGERCKWLWRGKPRKTLFQNIANEHNDEGQHSDEDGKYIWENSSSEEEEEAAKPRHSQEQFYNTSAQDSKSSLLSADREQARNRHVLRTVTGRMNEARSGLGRFREAVETGFRGHSHRPSKEAGYPELLGRDDVNELGDDADIPLGKLESANEDESHAQSEAEYDGKSNRPSFEITPEAIQDDDQETALEHRYTHNGTKAKSHQGKLVGAQQEITHISDRDVSKHNLLSRISKLRRSQSLNPEWKKGSSDPSLSSELLVRSVSEDLAALDQQQDEELENSHLTTLPEAAFAIEQYRCIYLQQQLELTNRLKRHYLALIDQRLSELAKLSKESQLVVTSIQGSQHEQTDQSRTVGKATEEAVGEARDALTNKVHEIGALGAKLEYEFGVLESKIDDVEDGVDDLNRQVAELESRAKMLASGTNHHSWQHWADMLIRRLSFAR